MLKVLDKLAIEWSKQSAKTVCFIVVDIQIFFPTHFFYFSFTLLEAQELGLYRIGGGQGGPKGDNNMNIYNQ